VPIFSNSNIFQLGQEGELKSVAFLKEGAEFAQA